MKEANNIQLGRHSYICAHKDTEDQIITVIFECAYKKGAACARATLSL